MMEKEGKPEGGQALTGLSRSRASHRTRNIAVAVAAIGVAAAIIAVGLVSGWFAPRAVTLVGAGATFPYPLIAKWSGVYKNLTGVQVNYAAIGSGGGINQLKLNTVDFAGSDAPLNATERTQAPNALHIPETIGAVTLAYNLPGIGTGLNVTGPTIADIFLGRITRWNHANLTRDNPSLTLPDQPITTVHRADSSGTTFVWTDYLSQVSLAWASGPGKGKSVVWPVGGGQPGNAGVAGFVQQNPYAVGYVELAYVTLQSMTYAKVQNAAGNFILPDLTSTAAAAANVAPTLPRGEDAWTTVSIVNAPGAASYPIGSLTYILVYRELNVRPGMTLETAKALADFLWWIVHDGQTYSASLVYVPLPSAVVTIDERSIGLITFNGQVLHP